MREKQVCDECEKAVDDLGDCLDCSGQFCHDCVTPEWDVPGWSNGNFRCDYCYEKFLQAEAKAVA